jgi:hypothetical protein
VLQMLGAAGLASGVSGETSFGSGWCFIKGSWTGWCGENRRCADWSEA